jgi:RNA-directed DNA polymerase
VEQQLGANGWLVQRRETDGMSARELKKYKEGLRKEAAERKALQKKSWEAYRDTHIVFLGDPVFWQDTPQEDADDLKNAEERAAANEIPALDTPAQLAEALGITIKDLRWFTYHRDAADAIHYRPFTIPKRDGTPRQIWAPLPRLKAAQRWVLDNILANIPVHGAAHGFLPERSILTHARLDTNSRQVVRIDIEDFFPTVSFPRVKGVFRQAGYREQVATLLALLCTEAPRQVVIIDEKPLFVALGPRCLPQGAPTSPAITNIACFRLDRRLTGLALKQGWRYSRYADDLTFSLPDGQSDDPKLG